MRGKTGNLRRVPDLSHLWQRFLLASSLLVGLVIGAGATIFGYSNVETVNVHFSVLHIDGVPLWTVAIVPLAVVLVAGTLYHWSDSFHHFTEHMRHRHRVHELEAEIASLRAHMDQVLEMPDQSASSRPTRKAITAAAETPEAALSDGDADAEAPRKSSRSKRATLTVAAEPAEPAAVKTNGGQESLPSEPSPEA
jgi:hypothetical protein